MRSGASYETPNGYIMGGPLVDANEVSAKANSTVVTENNRFVYRM